MTHILRKLDAFILGLAAAIAHFNFIWHVTTPNNRATVTHAKALYNLVWMKTLSHPLSGTNQARLSFQSI
jgi:hypothetical protein